MPASPPAPAPPTLVLPAAALKPGRVFIVSNLSGAYYTLLDLLAAHKFDFRLDNLMHVGNLVALPAALLPPAPAPHGGGCAAAGGGGSAAAAAPRVCRNSSSVLKLVRRHCARGPMGAHECLALLAAAAANRQRAAEEEARRRLLQARAAAGTSALSAQLAVAAAAGTGSGSGTVMETEAGISASAALRSSLQTGPATGRPWATCPGAPRRDSAMSFQADSGSGSGSDSDSDSGSDSDGETCVSGPVPAPPTPKRGEAHGRHSSSSFPSSSLCSSGGGAGGAPASASGWSPGGSRPAFDNLDLVYLLGLRSRVVLEPYGVVLQHAGPASDEQQQQQGWQSDAGERYHVIFSHRRSGGSGSGGAACSAAAAAAATATGLSCPRPVLRCAVLPPLRSLRRSSPGFAAKLAGGGQAQAQAQAQFQAGAPTRGELLLELVEQPLSELDLGPAPTPPCPSA